MQDRELRKLKENNQSSSSDEQVELERSYQQQLSALRNKLAETQEQLRIADQTLIDFQKNAMVSLFSFFLLPILFSFFSSPPLAFLSFSCRLNKKNTLLQFLHWKNDYRSNSRCCSRWRRRR
jgi:hypothetical protein